MSVQGLWGLEEPHGWARSDVVYRRGDQGDDEGREDLDDAAGGVKLMMGLDSVESVMGHGLCVFKVSRYLVERLFS